MNAVSTAPPLGPIARSMCAISGPEPTRASPIRLLVIRFDKFDHQDTQMQRSYIILIATPVLLASARFSFSQGNCTPVHGLSLSKAYRFLRGQQRSVQDTRSSILFFHIQI